MTFPLQIALGPWTLPAHLVFEFLAYAGGFQLFRWLKSKWGDPISERNRFSILVGAVLGALIGSKVLFWLQSPSFSGDVMRYFIAGKTVVGGLLGGWMGVEAVKKGIGEKQSTGDLLVFPILAGMAIGRVGCFLAGLEDRTHGIATALPWGIDFGDGIDRHPTQIYEIGALLLIGLWAGFRRKAKRFSGELFRGFMGFYLFFRFIVEFIKPEPRFYIGLSAIQWACLAGLIYLGKDFPRLFIMEKMRCLPK